MVKRFELEPERVDQIDHWLAPVMFSLSVCVLVLLAILLHVLDPGAVTEAETAMARQEAWQRGLGMSLAMLYPIYWVECFLLWLVRNPFWKQHLAYCLLPPLRIGARDHRSWTRIWLPRRGWIEIHKKMRERLEKAFSVPMILFALLVLPVILVEHFWGDKFASHPWLPLCTGVASGVIWLAFSFEFVVMMSVVNKRVQYCRDHWVDLVVILLPLVAFLRMARLSRLVKLKQLSKTARVYRMRGVLTRTFRAFLVLDLAERLILGGPQKRLDRLRKRIEDKEHELADLRELEQQLCAMLLSEPDDEETPTSAA